MVARTAAARDEECSGETVLESLRRTTKKSEETPRPDFGRLELAAPGYDATANRLLDHVRLCLSRYRVRAASLSRGQNTPACNAVQYAHTNPMPTQMPGGKKPNARPNASNPVLSDFFAFIAPRYNAAEVDRISGNISGPP